VSPKAYLFLADLVLAAHIAFAAYIVLGLAAIWIGRAFGAGFVHNPWFRWTHIGCMAFVLAETLAGALCPLTELEWRLRRASGLELYNETFMERAAELLLYEDLSNAAYLKIYAAFFAAMVITAFAVPIRGRKT
jgi:hypothetical protein